MPAKIARSAAPRLPDHTQLPAEDGSIVHNFEELKQSMLLTDCLEPVLEQRHPDGRYCIGQDTGIYWRLPAPGEPPGEAAVAPDWFYVPGVAPGPEGRIFRSYVMWQEKKPPLVLLEYVSGSGREERDRTPLIGKFWIYEQRVRAPYYGIYEAEKARLDMHRLVKGHYRRQRPNSRGHYFIKPLGVELGLWKGRFLNKTMPWLRWFDRQGRLLPYGRDEARQERWEKELALRRAEQERQARERAEQVVDEQKMRIERLAEQLRALGVEPKD
jgi:Uma2 family endonuclease